MEKVVGSGASPSREAVVGALDNCYDPCCKDRRISVLIYRNVKGGVHRKG